jgi:hypothetical protein
MAKKQKQKYKDSDLFSEYRMTYKQDVGKSETSVVETKKPTNVLFDMIDSIFTDKYAYKHYTKECIKQNAFMINRIMSIQYPVAASMLDNQNTNPYAMYYLWNMMLYNGRKRELWVYTKGSKKIKDDILEENRFPDKIIDQYCEYMHIDRKQFDDAMMFFKDELCADVNAYIEHVKSLDEL